MGIKKLYGKFLGGNVGNSNLITSTDYRYDEDTIRFLLETQWWSNTSEWFEKNWMLMNDVEALKKYFDKK